MSSDERALSETLSCYQEHEDFIRCYVKRYLHDKDLADDVVQEAFLRLHEASRWNAIRELKPYLTTVARNIIVDHWRRASSRERSLGFDGLANLMAEPGIEPKSYDDIHPHLAAALGRLPWRQKRVLELHYLSGKPYASVAKELGISVDNVKVVSLRARRRLRSALEGLVDPSDL